MQPYEGCELVDGEEYKPLSGFWYLYGETGLEGALSGWEEVVFIRVFIGASQKRESSESSDIGEYCKHNSSLKARRSEYFIRMYIVDEISPYDTIQDQNHRIE